eukprot:gene28556-34468_t
MTIFRSLRYTELSIKASSKCILVLRRGFSLTEIPEELEIFTKGRARAERSDSVTLEILQDRQRHHERLQAIRVSDAEVRMLAEQGLGSKKRLTNVYSPPSQSPYTLNPNDPSVPQQVKRGFMTHLASASRAPWPVFKHILPEIALAGHSNSGKSSLINALGGEVPSRGLAKVSDRAGWTDQICFYRVGKAPPLFTLADLPGYGHAPGDPALRKSWEDMVRAYLGAGGLQGGREVLARCFVLVDVTRGLCAGDRKLLRFLNKYSISWGVVLTKADLLRPEALAQARRLVAADLLRLSAPEEAGQPTDTQQVTEQEVEELLRSERLHLLSASTGAGVNAFFAHVSSLVAQCAQAPRSDFPGEVREHVRAPELRRKSTMDFNTRQGGSSRGNATAKLPGRVRRLLK